MSKLIPVRKLHAGVLSWRKRSRHDYLLNETDFRFAADCERMRVDRNGSKLSLLLIALPRHKATADNVEFLAKLLEGRLRATDTPGQLDDGRIAVLLPDTSPAGAWKVAEDISEIFPPGPERPQCEVLTYPNHGNRHGRPAGGQTVENGEAVGAQADEPSPDSSDFFFCRPMPVWKRLLDIAGASAGLLISLPVIAAAAAAIKVTSRGPVFFQQERDGLGGQKFMIYKLRTMANDAEQRKSELRAHSHQDGPAFKLRRDPRATKVGFFLRWTSFDELPQFLNVLKGEMSLVGPRPLPTEESAACASWQRRRLTVTPGMTCSWQVTSRGTVRFDDWVRMDLRYARKPSLWVDLQLILMTGPALILHRGIR